MGSLVLQVLMSSVYFFLSLFRVLVCNLGFFLVQGMIMVGSLWGLWFSSSGGGVVILFFGGVSVGFCQSVWCRSVELVSM